MAKRAKQLRNLTTRVESIEDAQRDRDEYLVVCMNIMRGAGLEVQLFDQSARAEQLGHEIEEARLQLGLARLDQVAAGTEENHRNAPKKKEAKKEWCKRLVEIRAECDIPAKILYAHRFDGSVKRPEKNWRTLEKTADKVIFDDCRKQGLPLVGNIYVYAKRLRLAILDCLQEATLDGTGGGVVPLFESRADDLLMLLVEMKRAAGEVNPDW